MDAPGSENHDAKSLRGLAEEAILATVHAAEQMAGETIEEVVVNLSGGTPRELLNAIASGDTARFQAVPGIGKRTAERIIVELREKVAGKVSDEIVVRRTPPDDPRTLAREGLLGLGFTPQEADGMLDTVAGDTPEDLISEALKAGR